jgi:hypothetical protein
MNVKIEGQPCCCIKIRLHDWQSKGFMIAITEFNVTTESTESNDTMKTMALVIKRSSLSIVGKAHLT